jgi:hypothetical protein
MLAVGKLALYIDRSQQQWIVRDVEGKYWLVPGGDNAWDRRQPFYVTDEADLEPIPAHYRYTLGLPD